jgi:hypothetical protein
MTTMAAVKKNEPDEFDAGYSSGSNPHPRKVMNEAGSRLEAKSARSQLQ